jgi:hypothetical protein
MKIALIEKTSSKITPLQIIKEDLSNQTHEVSSNFLLLLRLFIAHT